MECEVDSDGHLLRATIKKSTGDEFSNAALAYADSADYSGKVKKSLLARASMVFRQAIDFDEGETPFTSELVVTPSASARKILARLREGPKGKPFSTLAELDPGFAPTRRVAPVFPRRLQDRLKEGDALIEFYIDANGVPVLPRTVSASDPAFGSSGCQAITEWSFTPPRRHGRPTVVKVQIPFHFVLRD